MAASERLSRDFPTARCRQCGAVSPRDSRGRRVILDLGTEGTRRPREIHIQYSKHLCPTCGVTFNAEMDDLAPPGGRYTHRVRKAAMRLLCERTRSLRACAAEFDRRHGIRVSIATLHAWAGGRG